MKRTFLSIKRSVRPRGWVAFFCAGHAVACQKDSFSSEPRVVASPVLAPRVREFEVLPPQGVEVCFNAWDDNQNTLIDEGCGVDQGAVQFMIAWSDEKVDVDLYVVDPAGEVTQFEGATELGIVSSADCPGAETPCAGQNYENVYLEESKVPPGNYRVTVRLETLPLAIRAARVNLGVRLPTGNRAFEIELNEEGQESSLEFHVAGAGEKE